MKTFLWVTLVLVALIAIAFALPEGTWAMIGGLPGHPVIVHSVVVLGPLVAIFVIIGLFTKTLLKRAHLIVIAALGVVTLAAVAAKSSGEALAEVVGLPEPHSDWGSALVVLMTALFLAFALFSFVAYYRTNRVASVVLASIIGLLAGGSIALTFAVGHSGAASVWKGVVVQGEVVSDVIPEATPEATTPPEPAEAVAPPADARQITLEEVSTHNTSDDCWTVVETGVYDLTSFVSSHPGGVGAISQICGADGSELFLGKHGGQGAPERELSSLKIGELAR